MSLYDSMRLTSEERLWALIEERSRDGADLASIDARIWELFGERWAVVFTDLSGFSRKTSEFGIIHFLQVIFSSKKLLYPVVIDSDGLILKSEGDSLMLLFRTAGRALRCAVQMQRTAQQASRRMVAEEQVLLSIGIGFGDVLRVGDDDVWGREVNAASKLGEEIAGAHDILVTGGVVDELGDADLEDLSFEPLGQKVPGTDACFRVRYPQIAV